MHLTLGIELDETDGKLQLLRIWLEERLNSFFGLTGRQPVANIGNVATFIHGSIYKDLRDLEINPGPDRRNMRETPWFDAIRLEWSAVK